MKALLKWRWGSGLLALAVASFAHQSPASCFQPPTTTPKLPPASQQQPTETEPPAVPEKPPPTSPEQSGESKNLQSTEDLLTSSEQIEERLRQIQARLAKIGTPRNSRTKTTVSRARNFVRLSEQALKRDELKLAESHAERAEALLRDIKR